MINFIKSFFLKKIIETQSIKVNAYIPLIAPKKRIFSHLPHEKIENNTSKEIVGKNYNKKSILFPNHPERDCENITFINCDFSNCMVELDFGIYRTSFINCNMKGAKFYANFMQECVFVNCDFSNSIWYCATQNYHNNTFIDCNFSDSDIRKPVFCHSRIYNCNLTNCYIDEKNQLQFCDVVELIDTDISRYNLQAIEELKLERKKERDATIERINYLTYLEEADGYSIDDELRYQYYHHIKLMEKIGEKPTPEKQFFNEMRPQLEEQEREMNEQMKTMSHLQSDHSQIELVEEYRNKAKQLKRGNIDENF